MQAGLLPTIVEEWLARTDADGFGIGTEDLLYQLIRQHGAVQDRIFRIEFLVPGVQAYSFTFG